MSNEAKKAVPVSVSIERFAAAMGACVDSLYEACKIYAEAVTVSPEAREAFSERFPNIGASQWSLFENVGRGIVHKNLLTYNGVKSKSIAALPYSEQERIFDSRVEFVTPSGDVIRAKWDDLSTPQKAQLLNRDHIRTPAEQKLYIESRKKLVDLSHDGKPYRIKKDAVVFNANAEISRRELLQILQQL
jgi:hypothetical protein